MNSSSEARETSGDKGEKMKATGNRTAWVRKAIAAMFAAIHTQYSAFHLGEVFAIGVVLGAARALSGTVVLPIIMHAFHNAAALAQAYWMSGH